MAAANNHLGRLAAAAAASRTPGDGGPPAGAMVAADDDDDGGDGLFNDATAAIAAADDVWSGSSDGGGDRSSAVRVSVPAGGLADDGRLLPARFGSGLSALRLPPLKLPVSDDGSCEHKTAIPVSFSLIIFTVFAVPTERLTSGRHRRDIDGTVMVCRR